MKICFFHGLKMCIIEYSVKFSLKTRKQPIINPFHSDRLFHIYIDTISMELSILYFKGLRGFFFYKNNVFLSLKIVFYHSKQCRAHPDKMPPSCIRIGDHDPF